MAGRNGRGTALITGASAGIGEALARTMAREGWELVLVARGEARLRALADALTAAHGVSAHVLPADLADPAAPADLLARVSAAGLEIDALVNNAGFGARGAFAGTADGAQPLTDGARELAMIQVNVTALTDLTKRFVPGMVARGRGRVMNVASTAAFQAGPLMAVYYATKAYVLSFSEALAVELDGTGVTVTCFCPGATHTEFAAAASMEGTALFRSPAVADAASVAEAGYRAMMRGRTVAIPGAANRFGAFATKLAPRALAARIAMRLQA